MGLALLHTSLHIILIMGIFLFTTFLMKTNLIINQENPECIRNRF